MRAVDTNVLVRLFTRDDPRQTDLAEAFVEDGAWVSHLVLVESVWVLDSVYGVEPSGLMQAIEMLLHHERLVLENPARISAALDLFRQQPRLGFSDCLILATARTTGHLPLGTFDRALGRMEGTEPLGG